ncbi:LLM class F420-dependent oxidoreductase [Mycobacterium colombiense]|uniref:LLM class F420-dependent oxidoreductase n=1 Tax=Mycobacterium colombiense TaxID=339268 RepID=UPI00096CD1D3|nr:LLM class F420-dependent oxidoreductase [Mycobacterium colombiense]OMB94546.1 LLM class F420-dependent oxidoreductase [Mycobacterium colombiense]OMC29736.1 LLM class F420-dependent oxidoreductase [Mycobacterium colombiense]
MRLGLATPVVTGLPGVAGGWEGTASAEELATIAAAADGLGFDFLTCSEHVAVPVADRGTRGDIYWDPLATLAFLAARTMKIRLATSVVVLGYHHPLAIAKKYGTLDRLSGGRLILGVGVGSLAPEFDLLGAPFEARGERADDALRALRVSLSEPEPVYAGKFFSYAGMVVRPFALQPRVPIWVGGRTRRSLRRAVELADGWMPFGLGADEIDAMLERVELPGNFDIVVGTRGAVDPGGRPEPTREHLHELRDTGATAVTCSLLSRSATHYVEQLSALRDLVNDEEGFES